MSAMQTEHLIAVDEFCAHHNIEHSFVRSLHHTGLISITTIGESGFIEAEQLPRLEMYIRFYYELDINLEGIETINWMLEKIRMQQEELNALRNRLRLYELNG